MKNKLIDLFIEFLDEIICDEENDIIYHSVYKITSYRFIDNGSIEIILFDPVNNKATSVYWHPDTIDKGKPDKFFFVREYFKALIPLDTSKLYSGRFKELGVL